MTGSPNSWVNGKLGKAAHFEGNTENVIYNNTTEFNYTDNFSVALWVKPNYTGTKSQYLFTVGRADAGGYGYGLQVVDATKLTFRFGSTYKQVACNTGEWHHFVMYVTDSKLYVYRDGELQNGNGTAATLPTYSDGNGLGIGCFHYSGNIYPGYGDICDFRIYDHVLSPREVKEIAKGLVCHYTLSGAGGENILTNTREYICASSNYGTTSDTYNGFTIRHLASREGSSFRELSSYNLFVPVEAGASYTQSFWAKGNGKITCHFYNGNIPVATNISSTGIHNTSSDGRVDIVLTSEWKRYWVTHTLKTSSDTPTNKSLLLRVWDGNEVYVCGWKLEKGSVATPWTPNSTDDEYTKMGLDDGIEYDVSGYGRNGTKIGTITVETDSPRYWTSSGIENGNNHVQTPIIDTAGFQDSWTICAWVKNNRGGSMLWGSINGNRLNLFLAGSPICNNTGDSANNPFMNNGANVSQSVLIDNNWHHVAVTGNGTENILYIDGKYAGTAKTYKSLTATQFMVNGWNSSSNYSINGAMSDFRIYATALSAEDILVLYNNPVSLSSNGALLTQGEVTE